MEPMTAREIWNQIPEETRRSITEIALKEQIQKKCTLESCPIPEPVKQPVKPPHLETYLQKIQKLLEDQNKILRDQNKILKDQNKALQKRK